MVYVDKDRCTGCGVCQRYCPVGAIQLVQGVAVVDSMKCTECGACVEACPRGAIMTVMEPVAEEASAVRARPAAEVAPVAPRLAPDVPRSKVMPAVGTALAFLGRKVLPLMVEYVSGALDRRSGQQSDSPVSTFRNIGRAAGRGGGRGGG
ncbi:MAG: 4Fe-4S binding protein, partial [Candidatus Latescibacteria bacterium]|nr:4Fe-4S binding protein [Candidatus Latescibacterota bacterium]